MTKSIKGQCLCGSVQFKTGNVHQLDVCHCHMCQRWTGGPFIGADFRNGEVNITQGDTLTWYASSDWARRGFCNNCGSSLFYRLNEVDEFWAVCAGALDIDFQIEISKEIFIDEKPDFYDLAGDRDRLTGAEFMASLGGQDDD
jgi:hypothetical protein